MGYTYIPHQSNLKIAFFYCRILCIVDYLVKF